MIQRRGSKYAIVNERGKTLSVHKRRADAVAHHGVLKHIEKMVDGLRRAPR